MARRAVQSECPQNKERNSDREQQEVRAAETLRRRTSANWNQMLTQMIDCLAVGAIGGPPAGTFSKALVFHSMTISSVPSGSALLFNLISYSKTKMLSQSGWVFLNHWVICMFQEAHVFAEGKKERKEGKKGRKERRKEEMCDLETGPVCSPSGCPLMRPSNKCLTYTEKCGSGFNLLICPLARTKSTRT